EHYGFGAGCGGYVNLPITQTSMLANGPYITRTYGTTSGKIFYVANSTKREVIDKPALQANGLSQSYNVLNEAGLNHLPYGDPLMREGAMIRQRSNSYRAMYYQGAARTISSNLYNQSFLASLPAGYLDAQSVTRLSKQTFTGFFSGTTNTSKY